MSKDPHIANIFSAADDEDCLSLEQLSAYQEGRVQGPERNRMERHLLDCELCAMTLESIAEHGVEDIQAGAEEVTERAWSRLEQKEKRKRRGAFFWIAAAASVAILITVGFFTLGGPTAEQFDKASTTAENGTPPLPPDTGTRRGIAMKRMQTMPTETAPVEDDQAMKPKAEPLPSPMGGGKGVGPSPGNASGSTMNHLESKTYGGDFSNPALVNVEPFLTDAGAMESLQEEPAQPTFTNSAKAPLAQDKIQVAPSPTMAMNYPKGDAKGGMKGGLGKGDANRKEAEKSVPAKEVQNDRAVEIAASEERSETDDMDYKDADDEVQTLSDVQTTDVVVVGNAAPRMDNGVEQVRDRKKVEAKPEKGKSSATSAMEGKPAPDAYTQGMNAYQQRHYREAAANFRRATELTPNNLQAHLYAADAFLRISQPNAALYHCERILSQPGNSAVEDAEWFKALAYLQLKEGRMAKAQLETVIARNGKYKALAEEALAKLR